MAEQVFGHRSLQQLKFRTTEAASLMRALSSISFDGVLNRGSVSGFLHYGVVFFFFFVRLGPGYGRSGLFGACFESFRTHRSPKDRLGQQAVEILGILGIVIVFSPVCFQVLRYKN